MESVSTTPEELPKKQYVRDALNALCARCDGANSEDGQGFNKNDSSFAHSINRQPFWSEKQEIAIYRVMHRYVNQLARMGFNYSNLAFETKEGRTKDAHWKQVKEERETAQKVMIAQGGQKLTVDNGLFRLKSFYEFLEKAKSIPTHRWDATTKTWTYQINETTAKMMKSFVESGEISADSTTISVINESIASKDRLDIGIKEIASIKTGDVPEVNVPLKANLFDHQKKAFAISSSVDSSALLMEQGTGKTFAAIATVGKRFLDGEVRKLLVVCPTAILHVWKGEFEKFALFPHEVKIVVGTSEKRKKTLESWETTGDKLHVAVINYESSWRVLDAIKAWNPDMIICDESQKIKNPSAKQTKGLIELGDVAKYKMILTGTPVTQGVLDFWSQYRFLDSRIFGTSYYRFRNQYAIMGGYMNKQVVGYQNLEDAANKAHSIAYRVTKKEAIDLPDEMDQTIYACLDSNALKFYKEMESRMWTEIEGKEIQAQIVLTKLMKLAQITGGFVNTDDGSTVEANTAKIDALRDLIDSYPKGKKIVIFANFRAEIAGIVKTVKELGRTVAEFTGDTPYDMREKINIDFQTKEYPEVLVLQAQTGGRGITLTAADTIIFYSLNYSLENYEQAKARIHRIGQTNKVTYVHIITKGSVDETILDALKSKKDVADLVVDRLKNNYLKTIGK
jgi:SNF2 family DNA or RNA helicase